MGLSNDIKNTEGIPEIPEFARNGDGVPFFDLTVKGQPIVSSPAPLSVYALYILTVGI